MMERQRFKGRLLAGSGLSPAECTGAPASGQGFLTDAGTSSIGYAPSELPQPSTVCFKPGLKSDQFAFSTLSRLLHYARLPSRLVDRSRTPIRQTGSTYSLGLDSRLGRLSNVWIQPLLY